MKILAVDDDPISLELLRLQLAKADKTDLTTAESGYEALDVLRKSDELFDCLIIDIEMPGMSGIELCRHVRALKDYTSTPIIMLTARSDLAAIAGAFNAGANDYVTKPFCESDINARLDVAHRMGMSQELLPVMQGIRHLSDTGAGSHAFEIDEPLKLPAESLLSDPFSLGNYLAKLDRKTLKNNLVFALKIEEIEDLYNTCTTPQFIAILSDLSKAIHFAAENPHTLNAYVGDGTFICLTSEDILDLQPTIGMNVENTYYRLASERGDFGFQAVTIKMGRTIRPNGSRTHRVRPTFDRALSALARAG